MTDVVLSVRGLSKRYVRGPEQSVDLGRLVSTLLREPYRQWRGRPQGWRRPARESFWALKDVTFDVRRGERVGIIGKNGAGKSTLLKILARIAYPTEGEARIRGRVTSLLEVGTGFNTALSGRENIWMSAAIQGLQRDEIAERFEAIVDFSGVREFIDTPVRHYSSGMFMRLAFAVAAHLDPDILLLDEVLAVGDLSFQQKCLERVEGLTSERRTLVFVSHSMEAIGRFCDRCLWLDGGRLIMDGSVGEVIDAYVEKVLGVRSSRLWVAEDAAPPGGTTVTEAPIEGSDAGVERSEARLPGEGADDPEAWTRSGEAGTRADSTGTATEEVRLVAARIVDRQRHRATSVPIDEAVGLEVVYDVMKPGKVFQPALHIKTATDSWAFAVAYTDPEHMRRIPERGRYTATAWVPPHLLNAGLYYVTVALVTPDPLERHCVAERALSFNVHERLDADHTARGLYAREFPGPVRPRLVWETRLLPPRSAAHRRPSPLPPDANQPRVATW